MVMREVRPALLALLVLTGLCGGVYPLLTTGIAAVVMPHAAHGSIVRVEELAVGSALIATAETDPRRFWPRPSATTKPYDALSSSGSNLGPTNPALVTAVQERITQLRALDPENPRPLPLDLVTTSASGLDPHISVAAARYQAHRIAQRRRISLAALDRLIAEQTEDPWLGLFGEPRVNVGALNRHLERLAQ